MSHELCMQSYLLAMHCFASFDRLQISAIISESCFAFLDEHN